MKKVIFENKREIIILCIILLFLLYYDLSLIAFINDAPKVANNSDIAVIYTNHPTFFLSRLFKSLFRLQYFDSVGLKEVFLTIVYTIETLNIFDILFIIILWYFFYQFTFKNNKLNYITVLMFGSHLFLFTILTLIFASKLYNSLVLVNVGLNKTMVELANITTIFLILYVTIIIIGALASYYYLRYLSKK
ncbi:MAG: hypothetical protein SO253_00590 [Bacilli bacterium]|nr:hypothetical protein [Bacilli bacterium]